MGFDFRIIRVTFDIGGTIKTYASPFFITVNGTKYGNPLQNEAEIIIGNLDKDTRDYLVTASSPYNPDPRPKSIIVEAGRESYGVSTIYEGNIVTSVVTQPPDIGIVLKCLTGNFIKGNVISRNQPGQETLGQIAQQVADDTATLLKFQAKQRNIANYNFTGSALNQLKVVGNLGGINIYIDDKILVVKDAFVPLQDTLVVVSAETGMVGIPEFTEQGIRVKFLLDTRAVLGGGLQIISKLYPAANGIYVIYKLGFQISTRETPFYYVAEAARLRDNP